MNIKGGLFRGWHSSDNSDGLYVAKNDILTANVSGKEYKPLNIDKVVNVYSSFGGKNKMLKKNIQDNIENLYIEYMNNKKSGIKSYFIKKGGLFNNEINTNLDKGLYVSNSDMTNTNGLNFNNKFVEKPVVYNKSVLTSSFSYNS
jgi:hypothetical protein